MCRVLILDDNPLYAETIQLILQNEDEAHPDIVTQSQDAIEKVTQAVSQNKPYEILLIDHRLGPGKDGIEVFKELRAISPDADGIIFTGYEDSESGLQAYEAGAFRYLPKTADEREILFVFRALRQWRKEQREHNWQKIFSEMLESSIRERDFQAVARAVVRHSLKLGFTRAHLFWVPTGRDANRKGYLLGILGEGDGHITSFRNRLFPLHEWVDLESLREAGRTLSLRKDELKKNSDSMMAHGYRPPASEAALLPLCSADRLLGLLMLDYGQVNKFINEHERGWLDLFAKQASLALEQAALYTREIKTTQEQAIANQIGQEITAEATDKTLPEILEEVRGKLSAYFDTDNFTAILIDRQTNELDLHLRYQAGQMSRPERRPRGSGLEGWFLERGEPLLIDSNVAGYLYQNKIQTTDAIPSCWMGAPLKVNGKIIGGITLQKFQQECPFVHTNLRFLSLIADQVAGAIQNCRAAEKERQEIERLNVLSRAGFEMLQEARENEENLWKITLTLATANFGAGFNRAMLFLLAEQASLVGRAAIGTEDINQARRDWQADELRHYTFDDFLHDLHTRNLKPTELDSLIQSIEIPLKGRNDAFTRVLQTGQPIRLDADEARSQLPSQVTSKISLSHCAALPLITEKGKVEGIVLVDNKHNGNPILTRELNRLQTVLNYAGLIWETLREREKSENLLYANQEIMSHSGQEGLVDTLSRICNAALGLSEADWCIIYPFTSHGRQRAFDVENISYAGELKSTVKDVLGKKRPSSRGMTSYILEKNSLFIEDVHDPEAKIGRKRIDEHHFIHSEGIQAMIGMSIRDAYSNAPLGVFYMNFREPHQFSERDRRHVQSFASLAAFAIANARRMDEQEQRRRLEAALQTAEAVNSGVGQEEMIKSVLERLHSFFHETTLCVLSYDEGEQSLKFASGALEFYKITNPGYRRMRNFPLGGDSLACAVARKALKSGKIEILNIANVHDQPNYLGLIVETQSELCASLIGSDHKLLGVLALERRTKAGFNSDDEALVQTVARQLSLGLERFKNQQDINFNKTIAVYNAWASDMAHEINAEAANIQGWAYLIKEHAEESLTIQKFAGDIEQSVQKLLLATPRSDQGRAILPLDESLQKIATQICQQKGLPLQILTNAPGVSVEANPLYFQRILRHLIHNAEHAMRGRKEKKIILRTQKIGEDMVEIQVQDSGPGIPDKIRPLLFQTNVTTKGGGGNGLLITRQLVEEMNGTIRLLPANAHQGAIFSIKLPLYRIPEDRAEG